MAKSPERSPATPSGGSDARSHRRVLYSTFLGGVLEWYDFYLYATASAIIFNVLFFAPGDPVVGTIASFGVLAVGYVARPVGAVIFGHFGDRFGRKNVLIFTLLAIGSVTVIIGLLPTYASIGIWAPVLLIVLRIVQGLSAGGEYGGALLMAVEHTARGRWRGLASSAASATAPLGAVLATAALMLVSLLPRDAFLSWGWRLPFLLSVVMVAVGLWIRLGIRESPVFEQAKSSAQVDRAPFLKVLTAQPARLVIGMVLTAALLVFGVIVYVFGVSYAVQAGFSRSAALAALMVAQGVQVLLTPVFAGLSDKVGRRPVLLVGTALQAVLCFGFFAMVDSGSTGLLFLAFAVATAANSLLSGAVGAVLPELFSVDVRYTGVSVTYAVGSTIGGVGPLVAASLLAAAGGPPHTLYLSLVMFAVCLIGLAVAAAMRETRGVELSASTGSSGDRVLSDTSSGDVIRG